ncbi:MAG: ribonuclease III [Myxococcota bacterium]|nr:ribonuclease III [Myxococcota bacterium]
MSASEESERKRALNRLQERLGHTFNDPEILETALRHSSFANERPGLESNERLEFLGDAVIGLVIGDALFRTQRDWQEGELTRGLHRLVDKPACATQARSLELGGLLKLGRTEEQSGGATKESILADAFEAVMGALFLDGSLGVVTAFLESTYAEHWRPGGSPAERDAKTRLQESLMAEHGTFPRYELISDTGVEGAENRFTSSVIHEGETLGQGVGRTKRGAEFEAARTALAHRQRALGAKV